MGSDDQNHPCLPRAALCGAGGQGEASTGGAGNIREAGLAATSGEVCVVSIGSVARDCEGRGGAGDTGGAAGDGGAGDGGAGDGGGNILPSQPEPASLGQEISSLEASGSGEEQDEAGVGEGEGRPPCGAGGEVAAGAE